MISALLSAHLNVRAAFRLARTGLHLFWGCVTVALVFPFVGLPRRRALKQRWSQQLMDVLGIRVVIESNGQLTGLLVANHISFLDIYVINALEPAAFVSKDEVADWPLIGWLCRHTETIFLARGNRRAAQRTSATMTAQLRSGACIAVFPEGTSSRGDAVLPFHSALFQPAVDAGTTVTPVALRYEDRTGRLHAAPAYVDDITLLECLWSIACATGLVVRVAILPALDPAAAERRHLSAAAHQAISERLNPSRPAPPDVRRGVEIPRDLPTARPSTLRPRDNLSPTPSDSFPA